MFAIRTVRATRLIAGVIAAFLIVIGAMAVIFPGERKTLWESFVFWAWALPLALLVWWVAEVLAKWLFNRPWIKGLSSPARVAVGVVGIVAVFAIVVAVRVMLGHAP